jgi:hypothetical protein
METIDWIYDMACSLSKHLIAGSGTTGQKLFSTHSLSDVSWGKSL